MNANVINMRPLHWSDIGAASALEVRLFPRDPWSVEQFWSELAAVPSTRWYEVAESPTGIVGYVGLYAVPGGDADVQTLAVDPEQQGNGIGRRLFADLLAEVERRGCPRVFLEVAAENERAQRFYKQFDFERISVRRDYYGPGFDAHVMRRGDDS
ncbi:MAG: ribosomal protein S18-alanine N-acetyltransferase [Actinomycetes bacterium]